MRLFEWEAKTVLREAGLAVPRGKVVSDPAGARRVSLNLGGRVAVKAQVLQGGRMKAGLIRFADNADGAARAAACLLGRSVDRVPVTQLLVEEAISVQAEYFAGITYDDACRRPVLVLSGKGGVHVEDEAREGHVVRLPLDPRRSPPSFQVKEAAWDMGLRGLGLTAATAAIDVLIDCFFAMDATLLEVNPLGQLNTGNWVALDAHIALDDDAIFRQDTLMRRFQLLERGEGHRPLTPLEHEAREIDALDHRGVAGRVVEFQGEIGLLIGGGGASLTAFDAVRQAGGRPANYCEVGGNPSVRKVAALTRLLLGKPGVRRLAVIMNVVSNTRADLMARGVIEGCFQAGREPSEAIAVFRIPGSWEAESRELLNHYSVRYAGRDVSIDQAAQVAVSGGD